MNDNTDYRVIKSMRFMAWERTKGELRAILHTYWVQEDEVEYQKIDELILNFIKEMDDEIL